MNVDEAGRPYRRFRVKDQYQQTNTYWSTRDAWAVTIHQHPQSPPDGSILSEKTVRGLFVATVQKHRNAVSAKEVRLSVNPRRLILIPDGERLVVASAEWSYPPYSDGRDGGNPYGHVEPVINLTERWSEYDPLEGLPDIWRR